MVYASGNEQQEYFDSETGLLLGWEGTRDLGPSFGVVPVVSTFRDYKPFGTVKQPTTVLQQSIGLLQTFRMDSYEFDVVPPAAFDLPAPIKAWSLAHQPCQRPLRRSLCSRLSGVATGCEGVLPLTPLVAMLQ